MRIVHQSAARKARSLICISFKKLFEIHSTLNLNYLLANLLCVRVAISI